MAAKKQIKQKEKSKGYYDEKAHNINLRVGDMVYGLKEPRAGKLDRYRKEPCSPFLHNFLLLHL